MAWCSYLAIYIAVVDSCLEYNLHKNIYMHTSIIPSTVYASVSMLFHFSRSSKQIFPPHIHTGEIELVVVYLFVHQSVCLSICLSISLSVKYSPVLLQSPSFCRQKQLFQASLIPRPTPFFCSSVCVAVFCSSVCVQYYTKRKLKKGRAGNVATSGYINIIS